jgi:uncharacterized membrane protein YoaK (UPF0700 family)
MSASEDIFSELLNLIGRSIEGASPKSQWQTVLVFSTIFGVIVGVVTAGLTSLCWFVIAGICGVAFLLVTLMSE